VSDPQVSPGAPAPVVTTTAPPDTVTVAIARDPSLVRTVRLVAAAVARRASVHEAMIEEIRLAVGEACAVMIGIDEAELGDAADPADQVIVRLTLSSGLDASIEGRVADLSTDLAGLDLNPWALLQGLSDALTVREDGGRTTVTMSWPLTVTGP
jgi:hypothetical protein